MTKERIKAAMEAAGLIMPKVVPFMKRDQSKVFDLYAGTYDATKKVRVPYDCAEDDLNTAIESLKA